MAAPAGRLRRSRYLSLRPGADGRLLALSALAGRETPLSALELQALLELSEDEWVWSTHDATTVRSLVDAGLVVSEDGGGVHAEYRRREERLRAPAWNRDAVLFHATTRWRGVRASPPPPRRPRSPDVWPPPPHFHTVASAVPSTALPPPRADGELYDVLRARRTTLRGFDLRRALSRDQLSTILYWVWGCHGTRVAVPGELTLLHRTSPSGGSQHSGEVYPLVRDVEGVAPGLYHYSVEHHALELVDALPDVDLVGLNDRLLAGQDQFASAAVVFYLTCRFARTFWKYPRHQKAYKVTLFDAAHLSQTMYLVCTDLHLGVFVTAAFNEGDVDELLGLSVFDEGAVLAMGCGHQAHPQDEPSFAPYDPA